MRSGRASLNVLSCWLQALLAQSLEHIKKSFEDLSPPLQSMLESLSVEHDQVAGFAQTLLANNEVERLEKIRAHPERMRRSQHPAVGCLLYTSPSPRDS